MKGLTSQIAQHGAYTGNYWLNLEDDLFGLPVCDVCINFKTVRTVKRETVVFNLVTLFRSR